MSGLKMTYWKLIEQYRIIIPKIQRDYAQGRDNSQARDVRSTFIPSVFDAVNDCAESDLELDFIYGRVSDGRFVPIDGQQRLTTLHLIHVYLALRLKPQSKEDLLILSKFRYETRDSSSEFCAELVKIDNWIGCGFSPGEFGKWVCDQPWFQPEWRGDPTVDGMIRTLEDIDGYVNGHGVDCERAFEKLKQCESVHFQFMPMNKYGLSDDLYIKMNARGLALTVSQRFKSSFEKYYHEIRDGRQEGISPKVATCIDTDETILTKKPGSCGAVVWNAHLPKEKEKRFVQLFDNEWAEFFWKSRDSFDKRAVVESESDEFAFVSRLLAMAYVEMQQQAQALLQDKVFDALVMISGNEKFIPFRETFVPVLKMDPKRCIAFVSDAMTNLVSNSGMIGKEIFPSWLSQSEKCSSIVHLISSMKASSSPNYSVLATLYAIVKYFDIGVQCTQESFRQWMRICHNVIKNAEIVDKKSFVSFVRLWCEISEEIKGIVATPGFSVIKYFSTFNYQGRYASATLKQEALKAWIICGSSANATSSDAAYKYMVEMESRPFYSGNVVFQVYDPAEYGEWKISFNEVVNRDKWISGYLNGSNDNKIITDQRYVKFLRGLISGLGSMDSLRQLFGTGRGNVKNFKATKDHYHLWIRFGTPLQCCGVESLLRFYRDEQGYSSKEIVMSDDATYRRTYSLLMDEGVLRDIVQGKGFRSDAGIQWSDGHWCIHRPYDNDPKYYYLLDSPLYEILHELAKRQLVRISERNKASGRICGWPVHFFDCRDGVEYAASPEAVWRCPDDSKYKGVPWTNGLESVINERMLDDFISAMKRSSENKIFQ